MSEFEKMAADIMDDACLPEPFIKNGVDATIRGAIAEALRTVRAEALEEAAREADTVHQWRGHGWQEAGYIATAIRALKARG